MRAFLHSLWNGWRSLGRKAGNAVARIFMSIFYFTIFAPFGLGVRLFSDPLQIKGHNKSHWLSRELGVNTLEDSRRQF